MSPAFDRGFASGSCFGMGMVGILVLCGLQAFWYSVRVHVSIYCIRLLTSGMKVEEIGKSRNNDFTIRIVCISGHLTIHSGFYGCWSLRLIVDSNFHLE